MGGGDHGGALAQQGGYIVEHILCYSDESKFARINSGPVSKAYFVPMQAPLGVSSIRGTVSVAILYTWPKHNAQAF
jgi:hypothetical protein